MGETHVIFGYRVKQCSHHKGLGDGGIGKTTLARVVFHMVTNKFEACCFLDNVRKVSEKDGLVPLQQQLITQILDESISIHDVDFRVLMLNKKL